MLCDDSDLLWNPRGSKAWLCCPAPGHPGGDWRDLSSLPGEQSDWESVSRGYLTPLKTVCSFSDLHPLEA